MRKIIFALVVLAVVLASAPFVHSAGASEVLPYSSRAFPSCCAQSHFATASCVWLPPQIQSQFLRLADLLDSSIQSFQTSQRVADLDGIDDAINALEQRSNDPSVTSLTLRSYLAQREQILYVVSV